MVVEAYMPMMKGIRCKEDSWVRVLVVSVKQLRDSD
jgi:hypothetical protein